MMNNMMKQSSIRKFVSNANEPKIINTKIKLIQSNTRPKPIMAGIKPIMQGDYNIEKAIMSNEPKVEQKEQSISANDIFKSMKYSLGKSSDQKPLYNQDLYNRIVNPISNNNTQINQSKIKDPIRNQSPAQEIINSNSNKEQNPLTKSDSYSKLKESYGTIASPSLKRREELMQFAMKKTPKMDTSSNVVAKKEGVAARMNNYNKNNEKLNRSRSNAKNTLQESSSSNMINKKQENDHELNDNKSYQKFDSNYTQSKENNITNQSIEKKKEESIERLASKPTESYNMMTNQMILRKKVEGDQFERQAPQKKNDNQIDDNINNSFNQKKQIKNRKENKLQESFEHPIIQKSDYPSQIFKKQDNIDQFTRLTPHKIENSYSINEINTLTQNLSQSQTKISTQLQEQPLQHAQEQPHQQLHPPQQLKEKLKKEEIEVFQVNIKKELGEMKQKNNELSKENGKLYKEIDESQRKCQEFLKALQDMSIKSKESSEELQKEKITNDELHKKIKTMEEDIEILNEELSTKDLELQVINKKFVEYQNSITLFTSNSTTDTNHKSKSISRSDISQYDSNKISDLEKIITELTQKLTFLTEDKEYTSQFYQSQLDTLNSQIKAKDLLLNTIPTKDDLIKQLTIRLKEYEKIIESLNSQISSLSPDNNIYEEIIIAKDELETQYQELENKYNKLKEDFDTDEELIKEHESINKLTEKMLMKTQDNLIKSQKQCSDLQSQLTEAESNERCLINKLNQLKMINNTIKEQIAQTKDNDFNMNDIINRHLATNAKIEMYERQTVLLIIESLENDDLRIRNQLVKRIIPKEIFAQASLESFEKLITLHTIRRKAFDIIISIITNNLLQSNSMNRYESFDPNSIECETNKKIISFYHFIVVTLIEYNSLIFSLERVLSNNLDKFIEKNFISIYMNIIAANQFIDMLIKQIKEDTLNIQFFPKIEGLKSIVKIIGDQCKSEIILHKNCYKPMIDYYTKLLLHISNVIKAFKYDKGNVPLIKGNYDDTSQYESLTKSLITLFHSAEKGLRKVNNIPITSNDNNTKISSMISIHFDISSSYYIKLNKSLEGKEHDQSINDSNTFIGKYERLISIGNKISIVISSSMEKIEKEYHHDQLSTDIIYNIPQEELIKKTEVVKKDLETFIQIKEDLRKTSEKLKASKVFNAQLKAQYDELSRTKHYNDNQLAEMIVKVGRIDELESSNSDYQKKIEIYISAINDLVSKEENYQLEISTYQEQCDQFSKEIEQLKQNQQHKKGRFIYNNQSNTHSCDMPDGILDLETLYELKLKERSLKSQLMKEKMIALVNDNHSNINKYIHKINAKDNEEISQAKTQIKRMNYSYKNIRMRMTIPSIVDLTKKRFFNDKITTESVIMTENRTQMDFIRVNYLQTASNILHQVLGRKIDPILFWKNIDYGVLKNVHCFNEKQIPIGTMRIYDDTQENKRNKQNTIPIFLSEETIKSLNDTFLF